MRAGFFELDVELDDIEAAVERWAAHIETTLSEVHTAAAAATAAAGGAASEPEPEPESEPEASDTDAVDADAAVVHVTLTCHGTMYTEWGEEAGVQTHIPEGITYLFYAAQVRGDPSFFSLHFLIFEEKQVICQDRLGTKTSGFGLSLFKSAGVSHTGRAVHDVRWCGNVFLAPFYARNDLVTKTGSGQTQGKLRKTRFCRHGAVESSLRYRSDGVQNTAGGWL